MHAYLTFCYRCLLHEKSRTLETDLEVRNTTPICYIRPTRRRPFWCTEGESRQGADESRTCESYISFDDGDQALEPPQQW